MSEHDLLRLISLLERQLGIAWTDVVEWLRGRNSLADIDARLASGDFAGVVQDVEAAARRFAADLHNAFVLAGQQAAHWLDRHLPDALVRFDQTHARAVARARANELELVQGLVFEQRTVVRGVMIDAQERGLNPRSWAREIRQSIGLTEHQERAVRSYRRALDAGDYGNALGRELRDVRSDRTLRAAQREGEALDPQYIGKLVELYRQNYVAHRAEVIARTESLRNVHEGNEELLRQAIERREVEPGELVRQWHAGPKVRDYREQHQAMNGQRRPLGQPFVAPDGTLLRYAGDPRAGARHTIHCRCTVSTTFIALAA